MHSPQSVLKKRKHFFKMCVKKEGALFQNAVLKKRKHFFKMHC